MSTLGASFDEVSSRCDLAGLWGGGRSLFHRWRRDRGQQAHLSETGSGTLGHGKSAQRL